MKSILVLAILLLASVALAAAPQPAPAKPYAKATEQAVARWQAQRFGMFIHWGPASLTGNEISWSRGGTTPGMIPTEDYDKLYQRFNPTLFDADVWAKTAKAAGMKYLVITAKHADGFCLWPSKFTDYNISNTPFKRDVVKELAAACKRNGIQFSVYYCITDWWHPDYPLGSPGGRSKKPNPNMPRYVEYVKNQTTELIKNYGPLGALWFDIGDSQVWAPENRHFGDELYHHVKTLQPSLVVNDRCVQPTPPSGDYSTLQTEGRIGGFNRVRPWETAMVIGGHWAWDPHGKTYYMTLKDCLQWLLRVVGNDGNFLLNVGPNASGVIEPEHVNRLKEVGNWLKRYGQGVYGTRGGPFKAGRWGAATCKGNKIYLYVMEWPAEGPLQLPAIPAKITKSRTLSGSKAVITQGNAGITLVLPAAAHNSLVTVVELTVEGKAFDIPPVSVLSFTQANAPARPAAVAQSLKEGRLGLWHLDEGSGAVVKDSSPHGWNGTVINAPNWDDGKFGKALVAGCYNAIDLAKDPGAALKEGLSMVAWVKATGPGLNLFGKQGVCSVGVGEGYVAFALYDSEGKQYYYPTPDSLAFTFDAWHHVVFTYDGSTMRIYIDGEEQGAGLKAQFTIKEADSPFRIGWNGTHYPAMLDEAMLYNRALTKEEVIALATARTAEE
ncbi:MAG: alpha-L-fucosidase [Armatimonadota bacterium]